jgi:hypothetical protein
MSSKKKTTTTQTSQQKATPAATASPGASAAPIITSVDTVKITAEVNYQTLVNGLGTVLGQVTSYPLPSGTYTPAALVTQFQSRITAAETTNTKWRADVAAERTIAATTDPLREEVRQFAVSRLGKSSEELKQLGFKPKKQPEVSAATKAASQAKAKQTRDRKKAAAQAAVNGTQAAAAAAGAPAAQQGGTKTS